MALAVIEKAPAKLIAMSSFASLALVAALAVFVYLTVSEIVDEQTDYASKINISGQQRMLSQRAAFFAAEYTNSTSASDRNLAQESISRLQDNHAYLLATHYENLAQARTSSLSSELAELFFEPPHELD
ncbi:MAG: type IV pili methyl-accepting chemotaxis transducer N-terminal domain-containing protein, partial [Pseudomonadota bacterium]